MLTSVQVVFQLQMCEMSETVESNRTAEPRDLSAMTFTVTLHTLDDDTDDKTLHSSTARHLQQTSASKIDELPFNEKLHQQASLQNLI